MRPRLTMPSETPHKRLATRALSVTRRRPAWLVVVAKRKALDRARPCPVQVPLYAAEKFLVGAIPLSQLFSRILSTGN